MPLKRCVTARNFNYTCQIPRFLSSKSNLRADEHQLSRQLPSSPTRTRFAPSPTGYLHLGSLRTALFNYLLAKATGGQFLLRVEDTDRSRTIPGAEERLYDDLKWAGLQWDEGGPYGPYKQSQRTALYQEHADKILHTGQAYRCFCSSQKLNELAQRRVKLGLPSDYDRTCEGLPAPDSDRRASSGEAFVVRLRVPQYAPEYVDLVYGTVGKPNHTKKAQNLGEALYEDPILLKSDGLPTYHLANVVDDHHMQITHVIRAAEWMSSTPKHLTLYNAFGWEPPLFAHVGLLQDSNRQKFSKRKGDLDIRRFADEGIFPEALLNYVALYGWSHTNKSDVFSLPELTKAFDLKFTKGNTVVEPHKLTYLQKKYAHKYIDEGAQEFEIIVDKTFEYLIKEFEPSTWDHIGELCPRPVTGEQIRKLIARVLVQTAKNHSTPKAFFDNYGYFFFHNAPLPDKDTNKHISKMYADSADLWPHLQLVNIDLGLISPDGWTEDVLKIKLPKLVNKLTTQLEEAGEAPEKRDSKVVHKVIQSYLRLGVARGGSGPSMHTTMLLLGQDVSLQRLHDLSELLSSERQKRLEHR
ncbi:MAG: hypothetical protein Q9218_002002 [Villophora microphyllina]